jgi:hypothetical protein
MDKINYSILAPLLKTGDIILFSGQYKVSHFVEWLEGSEWSHAAMVVRLPEFEKPLLWESTTLTDLPDVLFKDNKDGPKLVDLYQRLLTYGDDIKPYKPPLYAVRQLNADISQPQKDALSQLFISQHAKPNPSDFMMIFKTIIGKLFNLRVGRNTITCSELTALSLETLELLGTSKVLNSYMPANFSQKYDPKLIRGNFGPELQIILELPGEKQ